MSCTWATVTSPKLLPKLVRTWVATAAISSFDNWSPKAGMPLPPCRIWFTTNSTSPRLASPRKDGPMPPPPSAP